MTPAVLRHPELKYKEHIEGLIWTAMRGLDPRTGIATCRISPAAAIVCLPSRKSSQIARRAQTIALPPAAERDRLRVG
jgi:hypothetical protein